MAILYGTTDSGQTLPVQVNEFGQLVAKGLPGPEGPQGPPGSEGPSGEGGLTAEFGSWTPSFSNEQGGEALIDYKIRQGNWYKVGGMLTVWWLIETREVVITNPRGGLDISGLPEPFELYGSSAIRQGHYTVGEWGGFKPQLEQIPFIRIAGKGDLLRLFRRTVPEETAMQWNDLDEQNPSFNRIGGAWTGLTADAMKEWE